MAATAFQDILDEVQCYNCYSEASVADLLELGLLRRAVLAANPSADVTPQGLATWGNCFACLGISQVQVFRLSLLDMLNDGLS